MNAVERVIQYIFDHPDLGNGDTTIDTNVVTDIMVAMRVKATRIDMETIYLALKAANIEIVIVKDKIHPKKEVV